MAGVLKAKVGGQWVPIIGSGMSAEVARWNSAWGIVAIGKPNGDPPIPAGTNWITATIPAPFTTVVGRRYRFSVDCRAWGPVTVANTSLRIKMFNGTVPAAGTGEITSFDHWVTSPAQWDNASVSIVLDGDGVARSYVIGMMSGYGQALATNTTNLYIEDVGPVTPSAVAPANPTPAWINVTFQNGWMVSGWQPMQYRLVGDMLQIRGQMYNGTANQTAFTLPVGYRVGLPSMINAGVSFNTTVTFNTDGTVVPSTGAHISIYNQFSVTP